MTQSPDDIWDILGSLIDTAGSEISMGDDTTRRVVWELELDERMRKHLWWCRAYVQNYNHGAPGHLDMLLIDELATRLDAALLKIADLEAERE